MQPPPGERKPSKLWQDIRPPWTSEQSLLVSSDRRLASTEDGWLSCSSCSANSDVQSRHSFLTRMASSPRNSGDDEEVQRLSSEALGPASYLVHAGELCTTACMRIESLAMSSVTYSSPAAGQLREVSLTLATVERVLVSQIESVLKAEGRSPLARGSSLPEAVDALKALPTAVLRKRFPAGGIVSVCYALICALDDLADCLKELASDPLDRRSSAGMLAGGAAGLLVAWVLRRVRRAVVPVQLPRWVFGAVMAMLVVALSRQGWALFSMRRRLEGLNRRLVLILRIMVLASTIFEDVNRHGPATASEGGLSTVPEEVEEGRAAPAQPLGGRRRWSTADLIGDLSDTEFDRHASAPARRMLEATSLPLEAAELGTSRHKWLRVLKYFLDVVYSSADAGYSCELAYQAAVARRADAPWWGVYGRLVKPLATLSSAAWFALQPAAAAERASSVLHDCGIGFISGVWRAVDSPAARVVAALLMPRTTLNRSIFVGSTSCHLLADTPGRPSLGESVGQALEKKGEADPEGDVTILLYIHGGGFVGSSFASDVVMLARWAQRHPGLVVVYPHYSLSPEVRFPVALEECFQAYCAARAVCDRAVRAGRTGRIVMFGESAGGNLAAAVCVRCARTKTTMPDRLILAYPALNLNSAPSPSRALHLSDPVVPLRMLQRLAAAYMPEGSAGRFTRNPEVHPVLAPDEVLECFPRTELVLGGLDPLLDDGIEFHLRLRRLGVRGELLVYRALPHGFFTFNWLPPAQGAIEAVRSFVTDRKGLGFDPLAISE
jgi:acetyl esterase/lipase